MIEWLIEVFQFPAITFCVVIVFCIVSRIIDYVLDYIQDKIGRAIIRRGYKGTRIDKDVNDLVDL